MTRLTTKEADALHVRVRELATDLGVFDGNEYRVGGLKIPLNFGHGRYVTVHVDRSGAHVTSMKSGLVAPFKGLEAAAVLGYLRDMKERLDAESLAETLA